MASDALVIGDLEVMPHQRTVLVAGRPVELTTREFDIVRHLAEHPGWVLSAEQLADGEGEETDFSPDSVSVHISHVRRKLADAGAPGLVNTVRGVGYRMQPADAPARAETGGALTSGGARAELPGDARHELRDAFWELEEAVVQAEHSGSGEQLAQATSVLIEARKAVYGLLAE